MGKEYTRDFQINSIFPALGRTIFFTDFSDNLVLTLNGDAGYAINRSIDNYLTPPASLKFVTGPAANRQAYITDHFFILPSNTLRFYVPFLLVNTAITSYIKFNITFYDGTLVHYIYLQWIYAGTKWQYLNSAGADTDLTGGTISIQNNSWNRLEFGFNRSLKTFTNFIFNGLSIDMSTIGYQTAANAGTPKLNILFSVMSNSVNPATAYIDSILISED